jgi:hypothetical protein
MAGGDLDLRPLFPPDYTTARQQFRETAARVGWTCQAYAIGAAGPDDEDLTIDVAISPPATADRVLVVSSGMHGVEGPLGSAVQLELMERWERDSFRPAATFRCVLIHALNPFGFACSRRCDADNIDPNRNFLTGTEAYAGSADSYRSFDRLLNAPHAPSPWDLFYLRVLMAVAVRGAQSLKQALAMGQHDFPTGLFFGGRGPSQTRTLIERHMRSWIGRAETVVHLDIHTGLGAWGTHKLLIDYPLSPAQRDRLTRWFGASAFPERNPERVAYRARGSFGPWCVSRGFAPDYTFAFVEFGTYRDLTVLAGLRAENQAHHCGQPDDSETTRAKARLRELFCPASPAWRARAVAAGLDVVERAMNGLAGPNGP